MNHLTDIQQFMLKELDIPTNPSISLSIGNWFDAIQTQSATDCITTTVPSTVLMTLAAAGFKLTHANVEYFAGDYYVNTFDHQQLSGFLPYGLPKSALRIILVNRHTGALSLVADSAWPLLTLNLYEDFTTWSTLINTLIAPAKLPLISARSLAIDLTPVEQQQLIAKTDIISKLPVLFRDNTKAIHLYSVLMTVFPESQPGTPFFQTKLDAITKAINESLQFTMDDYNANVVVKTHADLTTSAA